jgi:hypothetical protein
MTHFENSILPHFANQIIVDGNLSAEDIHSLVLTSKTFHAVITDSARAQSLWQNALPYASAFLFNRTVRVYTQASEDKSVISYYRVHSENNRQFVRKVAIESGNPALMVSQEVKAFYDRLIACYEEGRMNSLDDFLLFEERHGKDFPDSLYERLLNERDFENDRFGPYQINLALEVLWGSMRFKSEKVREDQVFEVLIRAMVIALKQLPLGIDELPSLFYLLESGFNINFSYTLQLLTKVWNWMPDGRLTSVHLADGILEAVKFFHLFESGLMAPTNVVFNGYVHFGPIGQVTDEQKNRLEQSMVELLNLPDFSLKAFNQSVSVDVKHRDAEVLIKQLQLFITMIKEGYLTFKILRQGYCIVQGRPFLLSYCTSGLLTALREKLLDFSDADEDFFKKYPFFFQLEDLPSQRSSKNLQQLGNVYLDFCRLLKEQRLLEEYRNAYDDIFDNLFSRILHKYKFEDAQACFDAYGRFDRGEEFDEELRPFFASVKREEWTGKNLLAAYKEMCVAVVQSVSERLRVVDAELYDLYQTSMHYRTYFHSLCCAGMLLIEEKDNFSNIESLGELFSLIIKRIDEGCSLLFNEELLHLKPMLLRENFFDFMWRVKSSSFSIETIYDDKRFAELAQLFANFELWASTPAFKQEMKTFQEFLNPVNALSHSRKVLCEASLKYGIKQWPTYIVLFGMDHLQRQAELSLVLQKPESADLYRDIIGHALRAFTSVFDERSSSDLVNYLIKNGSLLKVTVLMAHGLMTREQYLQILFASMRLSILSRTRGRMWISDCNLHIYSIFVQLMTKVFDYVLKDQLIDYEKCFHKMETDLRLREDEPPEVAEGEMGE